MNSAENVKGKTLEAKLDWYTIPEPMSGCHLWLGAVSSARNERSGRYARLRHAGNIHNVSRLVYTLRHGFVPNGQQVMHKCDNPYCVNPDHLVAGTASDNMLDMYRKRRHRSLSFKGSENHSAKLTEQAVRRIKFGDLSAVKSREVADEFGVSRGTIDHIRAGATWRHIHA